MVTARFLLILWLHHVILFYFIESTHITDHIYFSYGLGFGNETAAGKKEAYNQNSAWLPQNCGLHKTLKIEILN